AVRPDRNYYTSSYADSDLAGFRPGHRWGERSRPAVLGVADPAERAWGCGVGSTGTHGLETLGDLASLVGPGQRGGQCGHRRDGRDRAGDPVRAGLSRVAPLH